MLRRVMFLAVPSLGLLAATGCEALYIAGSIGGVLSLFGTIASLLGLTI